MRAPLIDPAASVQRKRIVAAMRSGGTHLLGSALVILALLAGVSMVLGRITFAVTPVPLASAAMTSVSVISPILDTA